VPPPAIGFAVNGAHARGIPQTTGHGNERLPAVKEKEQEKEKTVLVVITQPA
jgi:hypothetical protein